MNINVSVCLLLGSDRNLDEALQLKDKKSVKNWKKKFNEHMWGCHSQALSSYVLQLDPLIQYSYRAVPFENKV